MMPLPIESDDFPYDDVDDLREQVDAATFERGAELARQHAVIKTSWSRSDAVLDGIVHGRSGEFYSSTAYFEDFDGELSLVHGECSCPVAVDCKHVVALVLTAMGRAHQRGPLPAPAVVTKTWQQSLDPMQARAASQDRYAVTNPLGIELTLRGRALDARLVKRGKTGWIAGNITWTALPQMHPVTSGHSVEQLRLLRELRAVYHSTKSGYESYYSYQQEKFLDLSQFESRQLWPLLDDAVAAGIELVNCDSTFGHAEFCLDVTRTETDLIIVASVRVDGAGVDMSTAAFLGTVAHGLASNDRGRIRLSRFQTPVPQHLQQMVSAEQNLQVPLAAETQFLTGYFPALRRVATIVSSDASFTPPEIGDPQLAVSACYGAGHNLVVDWEWSYRIGEHDLRVPIDAGADEAFRDVHAERRLLAELGLDRSSAIARREYDGIATMRFTTEVLPKLDEVDVLVDIDGAPADYRDVGDAVQLGLTSSSASESNNDWFDLGITVTIAGQDIPFVQLFAALSHEDAYLLLADGSYFALDTPELQTLRSLIEEAKGLEDDADGSIRLSKFQAGLWDEFAKLGVVEQQARAWNEQVQRLLSLDSVVSETPPDSLSAQLRPYQLDGFRWLAFLWRHRLGGILADDMGLGKTVQTLALICHARQEDPGGAPFLIVAPTSVVPNWAAECVRFMPDLCAIEIGSRFDGAGDRIAGADVVITSYARFRLDFDAYASLDWSALILDEAQFVKNHQSKTYQCARKLAAPFKLAITGTPMENNLMELWSLMSIAAPGLFPSVQRFGDYYRKPIEKQADAERLAQLRNRIKPLLLRRTKDQVATELPAKREQVLELELHPRHRKIYETHLQRERAKVLGLIDDMDRNRFTIFRSLTLLRQLSLDAGLVDDNADKVPSAKIDALLDQLSEVIGGGHRALVFSQFTGFLAKVRARLDAEGIAYSYLDGATRKRGAVVEQFKTDRTPVFLISLKAGGFGLNLTDADYVFLLDPWWNPATEAQAVDRTHRIGQTRNVMVYRLIAKDTIEEKVMALKAKKAELVSSVMDADTMLGSSLTVADIKGLFEK